MYAKIVTMTGIGVAVLSAAAVFLNWLPLAGLFLLLASFTIVLTFIVKAIVDNKRIHISNQNWFGTAIIAIIVWVTVAVVLAPGIRLSLWIDDLIERGVQSAYAMTTNQIQVIDEQLEETIQEKESVPWSWWWPPDWWRESERIVERKILKTVQRQVVKPATTGARVVFSIVFGFLRASEFLLYLTIGFAAVRSVMFSVSRAALLGRTQISFTLPHS